MSRPDKLYRVFTGTLETATFVKEQILEGATVPTWTVRYDANGRVAVTSTEYWELTQLAAWKKYAKELAEYGPQHVRAVKDAQAALTECIDQTHHAAEKIAQLSA